MVDVQLLFMNQLIKRIGLFQTSRFGVQLTPFFFLPSCLCSAFGQQLLWDSHPMQHGSVNSIRRDLEQQHIRSSSGVTAFASHNASRTNSAMTEVTPLLNNAPGEKYITPLPRLPLGILAIAIFSEPVSSTILLPFIYFMASNWK